MPKFRKKAIVVEAEQYIKHGGLVKGMCNSTSCYSSGNNKPHVHTIHNNQIVILEIGDWIIPEPDGEHFYPCKPDIFEQTYEKALGQEPLHGKVASGWRSDLEFPSIGKELVDDSCTELDEKIIPPKFDTTSEA